VLQCLLQCGAVRVCYSIVYVQGVRQYTRHMTSCVCVWSVVVWCSALQCVATCSSALQYVSVRYSVLQYFAGPQGFEAYTLYGGLCVCCSALRVSFSVLQLVAVWYGVMQCNAGPGG